MAHSHPHLPLEKYLVALCLKRYRKKDEVTRPAYVQSEACSDVAVRGLEKSPDFDPETLETIGGLSSS